MKIIALYSIKGGVGKTSTAVNLAYVAAEHGARVLLWDLDPQSAATWSLRVRAPGHRKNNRLMRRLVRHERPLHESVMASDHPRVDLLPASLALRKLERQLSRLRRRRDRLRQRAAELTTLYDLLIFDCPPGLSLLSENVFEASDALLVPLIPAPLSLRTLDQLVEFLASHRWGDRVVLPFFSMADRRKSLHRDTLLGLPGQFPGMLRAQIPNATEVERMGLHRAPVTAFAPHSPAARAYEELYVELSAHLWAGAPAPSAASLSAARSG